MMKAILCYILFAMLIMHPGNTGFAAGLPLLPYPQHVQQGNKVFALSAHLRFQTRALDKETGARLADHWKRFEETEKKISRSPITIIIGILGKDTSFDSSIKTGASGYADRLGKEGYLLIWNNRQKIIAAHTETGLFYALQSLKQLVRAGWSREIFIADWPSLPHRVVYDDISRGPISTVGYIRQQIERMSELKINGLSFYIEHVVQPVSHPDFAPDSGKLTIPQIKELSAYAAKHHMELIGSFQSFGHFEKILSLPQYRSMGETSTLISPLDPRAKKFLDEVIGELCDAFNAPYFNVNCDETFDLTKGKSKKYIDSVGAAKFYADHLRFLYDVVKRHNKKLMMWGDVALEHEEVLDLLPKDIIYLTWEYGDKKSYDQWIMPFKKRGLPFMVCPGILNSYRMFPDMAMAKANIRGFTEAGLKHGAKGVITTIWDDGGTYLFSGDWYGVYVAADKCWNIHAAAEPSFNTRYERNAYHTSNGAYVKALFKLMGLRALPLTYNLNDQLWRQKILSDSGKRLIINNSSAKAALAIIDSASNILAAAAPLRHQDDMNALKFTLDQYRLIVDTRMQIMKVVRLYNNALSAPDAMLAKNTLQEANAIVKILESRHTLLKNHFKAAWLKENQPYWLNVILDGYDKKISDLNWLSGNLQKDIAALNNSSSIPLASQVRLTIKESPDYYFQNWMLGGPFPLANGEKLPSFLYSGNMEYNKPPKPGDFTHYKGKTYRWQKFSSPDGGIVDLDINYPAQQNAVAYAYCNITTEQPATVDAFVSGTDGLEVFCNGEKVNTGTPVTASENTENRITLALQPGINHLLLKMPKHEGRPWSFTFRLDKNASVTTHKHKYQLNAKKTIYEAD